MELKPASQIAEYIELMRRYNILYMKFGDVEIRIEHAPVVTAPPSEVMDPQESIPQERQPTHEEMLFYSSRAMDHFPDMPNLPNPAKEG